MISPELIERLKGSSIEEIQSDPTLRLLLGIANKKKGRKGIDFSCPSCIWEAVTIFRKLSVNDFITLISKKMPDNRIFILKGEGVKARTFTYQRQRYTNENLTDDVAITWLRRSAKGISNFVFSPEAYAKAKEVVSSAEIGPVEEWKKAETVSAVATFGEGTANPEILSPGMNTAETDPDPEPEEETEKEEEPGSQDRTVKTYKHNPRKRAKK